MKRIFLLFIISAGLAACKIESIGFTSPHSANDVFFTEVIAQARERGYVSDSTQPTGTMDVYRVRFREQRVEESNILEWRMISENDSAFNEQDSDVTSGQDIYIYRLHMTLSTEDVFVYYSMSVNDDNNKCTGVGHALLGKLQTKDTTQTTINFYDRLEFRQKNDVSKLVPDKKSARRKGNRFGDILRFTVTTDLPRGNPELNISKITLLEINKTGGNNPVFYPVESMLGNRALCMHKQ